MRSTLDSAPVEATSSLDGFNLLLLPSDIRVQLMPTPAGLTPERLGNLWHLPAAQSQAKVILRSSRPQPRTTLVYIDGDAAGPAQHWVRWVFDRLPSRELGGGDAVAAQDRKFTCAKAGILYFPGSQDGEAESPSREADLFFEPTLGQSVSPGSYQFQVCAVDVSECRTITGLDIDEWIRKIDGDANPHRALQAFAARFPSQFAYGALALSHPPSRLLGMLPVIYREGLDDLRQKSDDPDGLPFFERYLLGFEDVLRPMQQTLGAMERLFRAYEATPDFLLWLGAWVCMPLDENLPEMVRRKLIAEAVRLFRMRGTCTGLSRYLEILTGSKPTIDDQPVEGMRLGSHARLGTDQTVLGDIAPFTFVVTQPVRRPDLVSEDALVAVIDSYKPAYTSFKLRIVAA